MTWVGHAYWLARTLPEVAPDLEFEVWLPDSDDPLVQDLRARENGSLRVHTLGNPRRLASSFRATLQLLARGQGLYHSPDWIGIPALPGLWKTVVTLHDLIPLVAPEWVPHSLKAKHPHIYRAAIRTLVRSASAVLTATPPWAAEIERHMNVPSGRVHVIPLGVAEPAPVTPDQIEAARARFGLGHDPFVLTVGRPEPYKGLASVIRAFAKARRSERLVIVGMHDSRYAADHDEVRRLGLDGSVIFTGSIEPETLECLYREASAYFTMSRFEFGLCSLEAMALGVPVLAANSVSAHTSARRLARGSRRRARAPRRRCGVFTTRCYGADFLARTQAATWLSGRRAPGEPRVSIAACCPTSRGSYSTALPTSRSPALVPPAVPLRTRLSGCRPRRRWKRSGREGAVVLKPDLRRRGCARSSIRSRRARACTRRKHWPKSPPDRSGPPGIFNGIRAC